jgi:Icc-related predicted phosphoesterase
MNVLIIADDESIVRQLPESHVDLLLSCGDFPDEMILLAAQKCKCRSILAVKGNHDSSGPFRAPIQDLHLKTLQFEGFTFGGFCGSWKYKPRGNYLFEQSEVESALAGFPRVDIFVTHNSPRHIHDRDDDVHSGFTAFNSYITRQRPRFVFHGHQHVNQETVVGATRVIGTYGFRQVVISA